LGIIIREHAKDLATVIIEPVFGSGGMFPAQEEFLKVLREVMEQHDVFSSLMKLFRL